MRIGKPRHVTVSYDFDQLATMGSYDPGAYYDVHYYAGPAPLRRSFVGHVETVIGTDAGVYFIRVCDELERRWPGHGRRVEIERHSFVEAWRVEPPE